MRAPAVQACGQRGIAPSALQLTYLPPKPGLREEDDAAFGPRFSLLLVIPGRYMAPVATIFCYPRRERREPASVKSAWPVCPGSQRARILSRSLCISGGGDASCIWEPSSAYLSALSFLRRRGTF